MTLFPRSLASNEIAWQTSRGQPGFVPLKTLADDLTWGTVATKHAVSWPHVDDDGFATMSAVQTGSKYWIIGKPKRKVFQFDDGVGNMDNINAFGMGRDDDDLGDSSWVPSQSNTHQFDYEGILLTPGMVL